jgi:hypothetical protein
VQRHRDCAQADVLKEIDPRIPLLSHATAMIASHGRREKLE